MSESFSTARRDEPINSDKAVLNTRNEIIKEGCFRGADRGNDKNN
jgi:hypothetical protein